MNDEHATHPKTDTRAPDFDKVSAALEVIPSDDEKVCYKVCCALTAAERLVPDDLTHDWFGLFDRWSQKSGQYDAGEVSAKWNDKYDHDYKYTVATIYRLADQEAPGWRRPYEVEKTRAAVAAAAQRRAEQLRFNAHIGDEEIPEPNLPTIMTIAEMEAKLVWIGGVSAVAHRDTGRVRKREHAVGEYAASLMTPKKPGAKPIACLSLWI